MDRPRPALPQLDDPSVDVAGTFRRAQSVFAGRFDLERVVACSNVRFLFVAEDVVLKRKVALRIHLEPETGSRRWFEAETELLARLDHSSIRGVHAAGYEGDWAYRVSKWIEGESLADAVARAPRSIPLVLQLARDLTSALEYAHSKNIVLRRIIPATVMLDLRNRAVITDLRFANRLLELSDQDHAGADPFLAPETWHGHCGDPASDLYTAGALLYFAVTGTPPASDPRESQPPSSLRRHTPRTLDRVIMRALMPDPAERYLSASDMAEDLTSELGEFEAAAVVPAAPSSREDPVAWEKRLRRAFGDQYELLDELGVGGFGSVYRARDLSLEREVAVKVLHPYLTTNPAVAERFRAEARLAAKLDHPNIVSIYGIGSRAGLLWYSMEYIAGSSLAQLVQSEGSLDLARWVGMMRQALGALGHAHTQGLVHRDLKPENILIDHADGSVQITDFGLALALHGDRYAHPQSHSGTPEFAAPEQMLGEAVDHRADLYALTAVGYYALTSQAPFEGASVEAVLARKATGQFPEVRPPRQDVSEAMLAVLRRGGARHPEDRFASAAEYTAALDAATGSERSPMAAWLRSLLRPRRR